MLQVIEAVIAVTIIAELSVCKAVTVPTGRKRKQKHTSVKQNNKTTVNRSGPESYLQLETL